MAKKETSLHYVKDYDPNCRAQQRRTFIRMYIFYEKFDKCMLSFWLFMSQQELIGMTHIFIRSSVSQVEVVLCAP